MYKLGATLAAAIVIGWGVAACGTTQPAQTTQQLPDMVAATRHQGDPGASRVQDQLSGPWMCPPGYSYLQGSPAHICLRNP